MAEYIDREAAIKSQCYDCGNVGFCSTECDAVTSIRRIPAADVREVVTCADCKHNKREVTDLCGNDAIQCITGQTHGRNWFCAEGKKREES